MNYRKKPIVIQAVQFNGLQSIPELLQFCPVFEQVSPENSTRIEFGIKTLEGTMVASVGDWIIKGVQGEFYPIKDEIFRETYEPAD